MSEIITGATLKNAVNNYVNDNKMAKNFTPSTGAISGLLDKIGKSYTIQSDLEDDLPELTGEPLPLGKTIEEWHEDLKQPVDDTTGADAIAPNYPSYRPASYSYALGTKSFKATISANEYQKACLSPEGFSALEMSIYSNLEQSRAMYTYDAKKFLLMRFYQTVFAQCNATETYAISTAYAVNTCLKNADTETRGIVVKAILTSNTLVWADAVLQGFIIVLTSDIAMARPVDLVTSQAFATQINKDIEQGYLANEGNTLNGTAIKAPQGSIKLYTTLGIKPILNSFLFSNTYHPEISQINCDIKSVVSFGGLEPLSNYAMLVDTRGIKLHQSYLKTTILDMAHYINVCVDYDNTAFYSRNTFVKIYRVS